MRACRLAAAEETGATTQQALEDQVEMFMKRQAELESGGLYIELISPDLASYADQM